MNSDITGMEAALRSAGISVERVDAGETLSFAYLTAFPGRSVAHTEMGRACNALIDLAEADRWEPVPVRATVLRAEDDVLGTWEAEPAWFEDLIAYRISEEEFSARVLETLEESPGAATDHGDDGDPEERR